MSVLLKRKACLIEKLQQPLYFLLGHGRKHALRRRGGLKRSVHPAFGPTIAAIEEMGGGRHPGGGRGFLVAHDLGQGLQRSLGVLPS
jgi:hypothetical protein